jgi:hypothetical protein
LFIYCSLSPPWFLFQIPIEHGKILSNFELEVRGCPLNMEKSSPILNSILGDSNTASSHRLQVLCLFWLCTVLLANCAPFVLWESIGRGGGHKESLLVQSVSRTAAGIKFRKGEKYRLNM